MWKPKNTFDLFQPILTFGKYFGLPSYTVESENIHNQQITPKKSFLFIFFVILISGTFIFLIYHHTLQNFDDYLILCKLIVAFIFTTGLIVFCQLHQKKIAELIINCEILLQNLQKLYPENKFLIQRVAKVLLKLCIIRSTIVTLDCISDFFFVPDFHFAFSVIYVQWYYSIYVEMLVFHFFLFLREQYAFLERRVKKSADTNNTIQIYTMLYVTAKKISIPFQEIIVLKLISDFIFISINMYNSIHPVFKSKIQSVTHYFRYLLFHWVSVPMLLLSNLILVLYIQDIIQKVRLF